MDTKLYWVGPRKTDIDAVGDVNFYGSVTIFGDGRNNNRPYCFEDNVNRVNHNVSDEAENLFFYNTIKAIIEEDDSARFYFYNPNAAFYIPGLSEFIDKYVNVNPREVLSKTNDKEYFQSRLAGKVSLLERKYPYHRHQCDYFSLLKEFGLDAKSGARFVFQAHIASGGNGTYIVSEDNEDYVVNRLDSDGYIVSVYREENIPVNVHAFIFKDKVLLSPGSIQLMREDDQRLLYRGADFIAYQQIPEHLRREFERQVRIACELFREDGYIGVCGIDGMICGEEVFLLEINNRFQASTGLVNKGARDAGVPSAQKINLAAFAGEWNDDFLAFQDMPVNYSTYFYTDNGTHFHSAHIHDVCEELEREGKCAEACIVDIEDDGYDKNQRTDPLAYLYRLCFSTNIASINHSNKIVMNENIVEPHRRSWYNKLNPFIVDPVRLNRKQLREYCLRLKVALLVQGAVITDRAKQAMGSIREATNNAVDIYLPVPFGGEQKHLIINVPVDIKLVQFSPFRIDYENGEYILLYYGEKRSTIYLYPRDPIAVNADGTPRMTVADPARGKPSIPYSEVAFLSTDRLRVHLTNRCIFKTHDKITGEYLGCKFCNIEACTGEISLDNVREVVTEYWSRASEINLTHFLVGGQTAPEADENLVKIVEIIRDIAPFAPIYAMLIPYKNSTIEKLYEAGMDQLSCNIEVVDDNIARKIMPGKRKKSFEDYLKTLIFATTLMGYRGNVRSMLIVGLEPRESLMRGIRRLAQNGIQPILSIFRPMPDTPLEGQNAPPMRELVEIFLEAQEICEGADLYLGPDCINCQNNTLALPKWLEYQQ